MSALSYRVEPRINLNKLAKISLKLDFNLLLEYGREISKPTFR